MPETTAKVKVRFVVEVDTRGAWGEDCSMGQIRKQGTEEAVNALRRAIEAANDLRPVVRFRIVSVDACDMVVPLVEGKS